MLLTFTLYYVLWSCIILLSINSDFKIIGFGDHWKIKVLKAIDHIEASRDYKLDVTFRIRLFVLGLHEWQIGVFVVFIHLLTAWFFLPIKLFLWIKKVFTKKNTE